MRADGNTEREEEKSLRSSLSDVSFGVEDEFISAVFADWLLAIFWELHETIDG
jgi:hypothetical protein